MTIVVVWRRVGGYAGGLMFTPEDFDIADYCGEEYGSAYIPYKRLGVFDVPQALLDAIGPTTWEKYNADYSKVVRSTTYWREVYAE